MSLGGESLDGRSEQWRELWRAALEDAGLDESDVHLCLLDRRQSARGDSGCLWPQGELFDGDPADFDAAEILVFTQVHRHRVAIWIGDRTSLAVAGLMRHELEHVRQFDAHTLQLSALHDFAARLLPYRFGEGGMDGGAYQSIPMEADANAAAAMFVRGRYGDEAVNEFLSRRDPDSPVLRSRVAPEPVETLPQRMFHHFATQPAACEALAASDHTTFEAMLTDAWPQLSDWWRQLGTRSTRP